VLALIPCHWNEFDAIIVQINYKKIAVEAGDVLCWQMVASVIAPGNSFQYTFRFMLSDLCNRFYYSGLTIKAVAKLSTKLFNTSFATKTFSQSICKYSPTALGLFAIPFIIKPIDHAVDELMDTYYRSHFKKIFGESKGTVELIREAQFGNATPK
jgi:hypothetical protein